MNPISIHRSLFRPHKCLWISLAMLAIATVQGKTQEGLTKEVSVVRPFSPTISDAFKQKFIPKLDDSVQVDVRFDYFIQPVKLHPTFQLRELGSATLRPESKEKLKNSQVKLGFGNYWTPMAEVDINTLRNPKSSLGMHLRHLSSQGSVMMADDRKIYAGYADNRVKLHGQSIGRSTTLSGNIYFSEDHHFLYGYSTDTLSDSTLVTPMPLRATQKDSVGLLQYLNLGTRVSWYSNEKSRNGFQFRVDGGYDFLFDELKEMEHWGQLDAAFSKDYKQISFGAELGGDYVFRSHLPDTLNYGVAYVDPWIGFRWRYVKLLAGPKVAMDRNASRFLFYPRMLMEINITNLLVPYLGLDGYYENHTFRSISRENPYVINNPTIDPTHHRFIAFGGLRGRFSPKVAFNLAVSWEDAENLLFFEADTANPLRNRFSLVYDDGSILKMGGEISLRQSDNLSFILKGNYFRYSLDSLPAPWHKPSWDANFTTRYSWRNKLLVKADLFLAGKYPVPALETGGMYRELNGLIDLNLGAEYRFNQFLSAFVQVNNLLSDKYYLWDNYPMHRINFIGGLTFIF